MESEKYRKKAMRIESQLLGKLAVMGQTKFAKLMGLTDTKVCRMKEGFFAQAALALAILEYGVDDHEIVELAKRFAAVLTNKKATAGTVTSSQMAIDF